MSVESLVGLGVIVLSSGLIFTVHLLLVLTTTSCMVCVLVGLRVLSLFVQAKHYWLVSLAVIRDHLAPGTWGCAWICRLPVGTCPYTLRMVFPSLRASGRPLYFDILLLGVLEAL